MAPQQPDAEPVCYFIATDSWSMPLSSKGIIHHRCDNTSQRALNALHLPCQIISGQILTIGGDDLFIPVEAVLAVAVAGAVALVVQINVHEPIALLHLAGGGRDQVDAARACMTN